MTETENKDLEKDLQKDWIQEKIIIFRPKEINVNYHWEWIIQIGSLCYGIVCRKKDNKTKITYNIDPDKVSPDFFDIITPSEVPASIFKMFQLKLNADIQRVDTMMTNLIWNKKFLWELFNFAESNKDLGTPELPEALPYTEEDSIADERAREQIKVTGKLPRASKKSQKKAKIKQQKQARKGNRTKK